MPPRLLPGSSLPPYTYVPGRAPHPVNDPAGHLHGAPAAPATPLDPGRPRACPAYLRGIDLFNVGFYWEAHEEWERVWHAAGRAGPVADFLKGLIKLAAAGVKVYEGRREGVRRHAQRAAELLGDLSGDDHDHARQFAGASLAMLVATAEAAAADPELLMQRGQTPPCTGLLGEIILEPPAR